MTRRHEAVPSWKRTAALVTALLLLPAAAPAWAHGARGHGRGDDRGRAGDRWSGYGCDRGRGHDDHRGRGCGHDGHRHGSRGCDHASPVRVPYYRPYAPPAYYVLPTAQVVIHGPGIAATVVYYPDSAPPVYAPGYCPAGPHYHPYGGDPGIHGSVDLRFRF